MSITLLCLHYTFTHISHSAQLCNLASSPTFIHTFNIYPFSYCNSAQYRAQIVIFGRRLQHHNFSICFVTRKSWKFLSLKCICRAECRVPFLFFCNTRILWQCKLKSTGTARYEAVIMLTVIIFNMQARSNQSSVHIPPEREKFWELMREKDLLWCFLCTTLF